MRVRVTIPTLTETVEQMKIVLNHIDHLWSLDTRTAEWLIGNMLFATGVALLMTDVSSSIQYANMLELAPLAVWTTAFLVTSVQIYASIIIRFQTYTLMFMRAVGIFVSTVLFAVMAGAQVTAGEYEGTAAYIAFFVSSFYCLLNILSKIPRKQVAHD